MKALNLITLALLIIGGLNWGLIGVFDVNLVAIVFGGDTAISRLIYILVGISALYQIIPLVAASSSERYENPQGIGSEHRPHVSK